MVMERSFTQIIAVIMGNERMINMRGRDFSCLIIRSTLEASFITENALTMVSSMIG